jgi:hypothetical protein
VSVWALSVSWLCVCVLYPCVPSVHRSSQAVLLAASCVCLAQVRIKTQESHAIDEISGDSGNYLTHNPFPALCQYRLTSSDLDWNVNKGRGIKCSEWREETLSNKNKIKEHWHPFLSHVYVKVMLKLLHWCRISHKNIGHTSGNLVFPKHVIFAGTFWLVRVRISLTFQLHCHSDLMFWSQSSLWLPSGYSELSRHKLFLFSLLASVRGREYSSCGQNEDVTITFKW